MNRKRLKPNSSFSPANEAEQLIATQRTANVLLRRGATIKDVSALLQHSSEYCELALAFFNASDATKLRALVEDWPLAAIKRKCFCEGRSFDTCMTVL